MLMYIPVNYVANVLYVNIFRYRNKIPSDLKKKINLDYAFQHIGGSHVRTFYSVFGQRVEQYISDAEALLFLSLQST